jgi:hypothetical protein
VQIDIIDLALFVAGAAVGGIVGYRLGWWVGRIGTFDRLVRSRDPGHWTAAHFLRFDETQPGPPPLGAFGNPTPGPLPIIPRPPDDNGEALIPTIDRRRRPTTERSAKTQIMPERQARVDDDNPFI